MADIKEIFNTTLPAGMLKNPDAAKQIGAKFQVNIIGDGGGEWYIDVTASTGPSVKEGNPGGADVTITITSEDFQKMLENPGAGPQLYFSGKLKLQGNQMLAMKLTKLFELRS
jgi:putative sterol carrier protein